MRFAVPPPPVPSIPVAGTETAFPVRRIWCVGRNYAEHAREMGHDPDREPPFFFSKPADAVVPGGGVLPFPPETSDLHHEIELVVAIGHHGSHVTEADALGLVFGYAVGLDMTRRDLQAAAKKLGRPWDLAKGFDRSCPVSPLVPASRVEHPSQGAITVAVNGEVRQSGDIADMIWPVPAALAYLSRFVALAPGDLLMTGTPAGVGRVVPGDRLEGRCEGIGVIEVRYQPN
jgi:fumarylpyruvate hydrolase